MKIEVQELVFTEGEIGAQFFMRSFIALSDVKPGKQFKETGFISFSQKSVGSANAAKLSFEIESLPHTAEFLLFSDMKKGAVAEILDDGSRVFQKIDHLI